MTPEQHDMIAQLLVDVVSQAPAVLAILFLIYRMETREQTAISTLLEIVRSCFDERVNRKD